MSDSDSSNEGYIEKQPEEPSPIEKPVKKKREYVMTEARRLAVERMKEARKLKVEAINKAKIEDRKILEKVRSKPLKRKPKPKQVIVIESDSSSEEENQIIFRRKRSKRPPKTPPLPPPPSPVFEENEPSPPPRVRRL